MVCIFVDVTPVMALSPETAVTQYQFHTWQRERGLDQRAVSSIIQTGDGYLWLGTFEGLVRFDGSQFKTFTKDNTPGLADNFIWMLDEDSDKNLWIGTVGGLSRLKDGKFTAYLPSQYPGIDGIQTITVSDAGGVWVGTKMNGLIRFIDGKASNYTTKNGLAGNTIRALSEDKHGRLWIATRGGISIATPGDSPDAPVTFSTFKGENGILDKKSVFSLLHCQSGALWIGCGDGLYRLHNTNLYSFQKALPNAPIMSLYEDSHNNIWVGTEGLGLARIQGNRIDTFPASHPLASDFIYAIFEDNEKNLWLGTEGEGLHRLRDTLFTTYTTVEGLNHRDVMCIFEEKNGALLLGTAKGINRLKNGKMTSILSKENALPGDNVYAILKDNTGKVWVGTDKGLIRFKNDSFKTIVGKTEFPNEEVLGIKQDTKGVIWILTGKNIYKFFAGQYKAPYKLKGEFRKLYIDKKNRPLIATYGDGFYTLDQGKVFKTSTVNNLVHDQVESFHEDDEGILYIGTREGMSLLMAGEIFNITTENGLLDSFVRRITQDNEGYLWLAGRTGISRIHKKEILDVAHKRKEKVNPLLFNDSHGLKSAYCYQCTKTADGKLWFATDKGLATIAPSPNLVLSPLPHIQLEELIADGHSYYIGDRHYGKENPLPIPAGTSRIEFKYTGISFSNPLNTRFKCILKDYDKTWNYRGSIRNISYNDLSPGDFTFSVKAGDRNGRWHYDKDTVSMSFKLGSYFYETWWFFITMAILILLSVFSIYRLRVRHYKIRQKELAREVNIRTQEVEEKNHQLELQSEKLKELDHAKSRFFANITHEFRTPLTLLIGPLNQMIDQCGEDEIEKKRKYIMMLRNAQRLLRLINQLLDLSKLDSGKMKLKKVNTSIVSFIHGITESFLFLAQQKELALVFHSDFENNNGDIVVEIDQRKMEDIMSNLLINAIKFTPPGGEIQVTVTCERSDNQSFPNGFVQVKVADTGPGIPEDQLPYVFDRFYQADATFEQNPKGTGIGLALCKELVELQDGTISAKNREHGGGQFIIRLPRGIPADDSLDEPVDCQDNQDENHNKIWETGPMAVAMSDEVSDELSNEINDTRVHDLHTPVEREEKDIILVVDDSADMREYIRVALEPHYLVEEAADGEEGIKRARSIIPDLIVSDIMMPVKDGNELCRTLKSDVNTSHVPIILLTAKASEENIIEGLETGADDYITKPFSTAILNARIKNLIDLRGQLQQNFKRELNLRPAKPSVSILDEEFLKELHEVLKKNMGDPDFNVEEMCKKLYMSGTNLYRKIRALCGMTPTDFIRSYRLKRSWELLRGGFGSVTEVAFEVGFSSRAYFTKCFKEKFSQLPSEVHCEGQ